MKNLIPESIAPFDIFKVAEKFTPPQEENTHLAVLFACYKLENILGLFASDKCPFSVAESADSYGFNFCNNEELLRMAYARYHEEDLVTGALFLAKVKKDRRAANYGALNPILEISRLIIEYKSQGEKVRFEHMKWRQPGTDESPTVPTELSFGFAVEDEAFDLNVSDDCKTFSIVKTRNGEKVAEGRLTGSRSKSSVANALAQICKNAHDSELKLEDII